MPLTDFLHHLNRVNIAPLSWAQSTAPFFSNNGIIFIHFANLRLESQFLPIIDTVSGELYGHTAVLRSYSFSTWQPVKPEAVFVLPSNDEEFVYLDRLVRTLHTLNYLTHHMRGNLMLDVHPRHVASVPAGHGLAFEEMLRPCGLMPRQITLGVEIDDVENAEHLKQAVRNYRSRGYGIAIKRFGRKRVDFKLLKDLGADIVKLDPSLLLASRSMHEVTDRLHDLGIEVMIESVDTPGLRRGAAAMDIDLIQAHRLPHHIPHAVAPGSAHHAYQ